MNAKEKKKEQKPRSEDSDAGTADLIRELGLAAPGTDFESDLQYISIIGSIEGHIALPMENKTTKYEHLIPQLIAVEENPKLRGLLVILNTMGGDVEAGLALAEMIATLSKPTVSAGAGWWSQHWHPRLRRQQIIRLLRVRPLLTLHPIRTTGLVITAETTFDYMRKTQDRVIDFIAGHSRATRKRVTETDELRVIVCPTTLERSCLERRP